MNSESFEQLRHLVLFRLFSVAGSKALKIKELYLSFYVRFVLKTSFIYNSQVEQT